MGAAVMTEPDLPDPAKEATASAAPWSSVATFCGWLILCASIASRYGWWLLPAGVGLGLLLAGLGVMARDAVAGWVLAYTHQGEGERD